MSLSRTDGRRRIPLLSKRRWFLLIGGFVLFLVVSSVLYVRNAEAGFRKEEKASIAAARDQAGIVETVSVSKHVWQEAVWVVKGKDNTGELWYVWVGPTSISKEKASEGQSEEMIRSRFTADHANKRIVHLVPAWFQNQPAWELRYVDKDNESDDALLFYAYKEGTLLGTIPFTNHL